MEHFKVFIAWAISPFIIGVAIQLVGWGLLAFRKRRMGLTLFGVGLAVLVFSSLPVLSDSANRARELVHKPLNPMKDLEADEPVLVVVLGAGFDSDEWLPPNSRIGAVAMARLVEGVRIYRSRPDDVRLLIAVSSDYAISGDDFAGVTAKKQFLEEMTGILALDPQQVILLADAMSTADEAKFASKTRKEGEQVVVVTSAGHMPRAIETFRTAGLDPVAAPTDFHFPRAESVANRPWKSWIPSIGGMAGMQGMLYEWTATQWQRRGGR